MTLDEFLDKVCQRPLPQNPMKRIRTFAKELAEGATDELWSANIEMSMNYPIDKNLQEYLIRRWNRREFPTWVLLIRNEYLSERSSGVLVIRKEVFALLEETEPSTIFISYKRSESSAFALLVLKYLEEAGLKPFLDVALVPGEDWHDGLKERIQAQDYFILLLGKTTLESPFVMKEITWALEKRMTLLPIWQPGFEFKAEDWPDLRDPIPHKLANTHTIRVQEENPLAYNTAMDELLNRFGITP